MFYLRFLFICFYVNLKWNAHGCFIKKAGGDSMIEEAKYYLVRPRAVPEVLLKVAEAKQLLDARRGMTVQEAVDQVGISRSSFYKYQEDIFPFYENARGKTINVVLQMDDRPGQLAEVLKVVAQYHANVLTIHQTIPINGVASLTLSIKILPTTADVSKMLEAMESQKGIHDLQILSQE